MLVNLVQMGSIALAVMGRTLVFVRHAQLVARMGSTWRIAGIKTLEPARLAPVALIRSISAAAQAKMQVLVTIK
jgi:hypothetical protein